MAIETRTRSTIPQGEMEKPVDSPVRRITVVTSSKFADKDNLVLLIDGKQEILVPRRNEYSTGDVSSAIFSITEINAPYAVRSLVSEERKSLRVEAGARKNDNGSGSSTYIFNQKDFISLINVILPEMALHKPITEDLLLPNGTIVPKSKFPLEDRFLLYILKEARVIAVERSRLAAEFRGGKSEEKALIRCNTLLGSTRKRLRSFGCDIVNTVSHGDATEFGKEPAYRLKLISDDPGIVKSKAFIPRLPPPNGNLTLKEEEFIEEIKGKLALNAADTILSHMQAKDTENLDQIEPNLENFFLQWFSKRPHSRVNFPDIVEHKKDQGENLGKFFIRFFRKVLESASAAPEYQSTQGLEANIITNYRKLKEKDYTVESIIQKVCEHFRIEYEESPKPATSSPVI